MRRDDEDTSTESTEGATTVDAPALSVEAEPVRSVTDVDALPAAAQAIDINAPISAENQAAARAVRDLALGARDDIDVNATIVSKRASTAAEHVRDIAFEKIRAGEDEDLRETISRPGSARRAAVDDTVVDELVPANADENIALDERDLALVARLRALPPEGQEPDWRGLETSIRDEVRDRPTYVPWWRSWRYLVPIGGLAATAVIALIVVRVARREPDRTSLLTAPRDAGVSETQRAADDRAAAREHGSTLWLDGEPFDIDDEAAADALDALAPPSLDEVDAEPSDDPAEADLDSEDAGDGILPITDYGWIDALDDGEAERAESWLARKRS